MSRIRVVTGDDAAPEASFADAVRAAAEHALAEGAITVCIVYETPKAYAWQAVPNSDALMRGLAMFLNEAFLKETPDD